MARARLLKPGFFTNEVLAEVDPLGRLLFAGLWCLADRNGRLEDRPKRIKAELFPYDDCNVDALLDQLAARGFILRYAAAGALYIQIVTFTRHQYINAHEPAGEIPGPDGNISDMHVHAYASTDKHVHASPARGRSEAEAEAEAEAEERERGARAHTRTREGNGATADAAPVSLSLSQTPAAPEPEAEQKPEPARDVAVVASSPPGKSPEEAEHGPIADPKADPYADLHEACVVALGHGPTTGRMRRKWREGLADLARLNVTYDDIPKLVRQYHAKYGDTIPCEPWNLADHYPELGASPHVLSNLNGASRQRPAQNPPDPAEAARRKRAIFAQHGIPIPLKPDLDTLGG